MIIARPAALLLSALATCLALSTPPSLAAPPPPGASAAQESARDGAVIVGFKSDAATLRKHALAARPDAATVRSTLAGRAGALGARVGRALTAGAAVGEYAQVVRAAGVDAATLARQLAADPDVAYAVPDGRKHIVAAPNDPLYAATAPGVRPRGPDSGQWYLRAPDNTVKSAIDIEPAWARTLGSASVVVAVLDTGVRFEHPDLARRLLPGYDFVNDVNTANDGDARDADPSDPGDWITADENSNGAFANCGQGNSSWHGTSTSSIVAARTRDATGMAGAAPGVRLLPVRVLGKCGGFNSDILAAMRWSAGISVPGVPANPNPAKVINLSLGGGTSCTKPYQDAVDEITARGVVIVAAAGNSAGGPVGEPASCRGVIGVLALRHAGTKVGFSDLGPEITIAAPGGNCINITAGSACLYPILAATNSGTQGPANSGWSDSFDITVGTSFSAPLVAGVAALMASPRPSITPAQIGSALRATARPFPTSGADNGPNDNTPVPQCHAPTRGIEQLQCYCTTGLCGAGMMDAGAALAAVATAPFVTITSDPAAPVPGEAVTFSITGHQAHAAGPVQYSWTLVDGGGAAVGFSSASNADTAALTPLAAGTLVVRLAVSDPQDTTTSADLSLVVQAAASAPPPATASGGGGGGGASSGAWVAGVALAAAVLQLLRWLEFRATQRRA